MASIGKKILSAFMEVTDETSSVHKPSEKAHTASISASAGKPIDGANEKFRQYFEKLFEDANLPGPDYYEFSKMLGAMKAVTDENARYSAAFAGLQVQGLSKQQLLDTAAAYLDVLDKDAANFLLTVDAALQQKVTGKQQEITQKTDRIQQLTAEINSLQQQLTVLHKEVAENGQKLEERTEGYKQASEIMKARIQQDTEKIKIFIQ